jgi:DNA mismatch repair ATPase MutS
VHYCVLIRGNRVRVSRYAGEEDYSEEAARAFERFREGPVRAHLATFSTSAEMSHVEARILDLVAKLYPDVFAALRAFCDRHRSFVDPAIDRFDREIQFYLAYLDHLAPMARAGLEFSRPVVSDQVKEVQANRTFDLALAAKRVGERRPVVTNDFFLRGGERMIVVTGPNQGGKTTFARTFGQLHHLASLGCPVPGKDTRLFLPDRILTHFEREEDAESGSGKLESDLLRMQAIFGMATPRSIVILNEMFTSTTVEDALRLSREMLRRLVDLDLLCVCVTFLDELSSLGPSTVSMVSTVRPDDPAERTFKVVRQPANGLAYAIAIAERHAVTYSAVRRRLRR